MSIVAAAQLLLDGVVAELDALGLDPPARRFVAAGDPRAVAWDGAQVTVALQSLTVGPPGNAQPQSLPSPSFTPGREAPRTALFEIQVVRCVPEAQAVSQRIIVPDAAALQAVGEVHLSTARAMVDGALAALAGSPLPYTRVALGAALSLGPQGGLVGVALPVWVGV